MADMAAAMAVAIVVVRAMAVAVVAMVVVAMAAAAVAMVVADITADASSSISERTAPFPAGPFSFGGLLG